jgi:hypothetical protein
MSRVSSAGMDWISEQSGFDLSTISRLVLGPTYIPSLERSGQSVKLTTHLNNNTPTSLPAYLGLTKMYLHLTHGIISATAQEVSRWVLTAEAEFNPGQYMCDLLLI